jgi:hypothetical protein
MVKYLKKVIEGFLIAVKFATPAGDRLFGIRDEKVQSHWMRREPWHFITQLLNCYSWQQGHARIYKQLLLF